MSTLKLNMLDLMAAPVGKSLLYRTERILKEFFDNGDDLIKGEEFIAIPDVLLLTLELFETASSDGSSWTEGEFLK